MVISVTFDNNIYTLMNIWSPGTAQNENPLKLVSNKYWRNQSITFIIHDNSLVQVHLLQRFVGGPAQQGLWVGVGWVAGQHLVLPKGHPFGFTVIVVLEGRNVRLDQLHLLTKGHGLGVLAVTAGPTLVCAIVTLLYTVDVQCPQTLLLVDPQGVVGIFHLIRHEVY